MQKKLKSWGVFSWLALVLIGCSSFNGLRTPLYDGMPAEADEEAINSYRTSREITGEEKAYYFRYPFSETVYEESLDYPSIPPLLLEAGEYQIGEDVAAGRASLLSNESMFTGENTVVHVGNLKIYDEQGEVYFENLFHSDYGQLIAQVDLKEGHTIELIGESPEITVFYAESFPEDPYLLMEPPEVLVNLDRLTVQNPIVRNEKTVELTAGIFEVGVHLEAGTYEIQQVQAPHNTELFLFREGEETRVFELLVSSEGENMESKKNTGINYPTIDLQEGDKIYPNLVRKLVLSPVRIE